MSNLLWGNLINFYQHPNIDRAEFDKIVNKSYIPVLKIFSQNPELRFTVNLPGSTVDLLIRTGFGSLIKKFAEMAERGQIDFTMSPKYQPVMPILGDDDIDRQIEASNKICRRYFGINYGPKGLFSPHMAYSQAVSKAAARFGLKWVVIDEISISNGGPNGRILLYMDKAAGGTILIPRHRELSDLLQGTIWAKKLPRSAGDFTQMAMQRCTNDKYFVTVIDAEYFGYVHSGRHGLLKALYNEGKVRKVTLSDLRSLVKRKEFIKPIEGTAETRQPDLKRKKPYALWQNENNIIQQTLWQLFNLATAEIKNAGSKGDPQYNRAREMFDSASASLNWLMISGNPWWNSAYALQAADDLAIAVFVLFSSPLKSKETAIAQRLKLYEDIDQFEKNGEIKKWQKNCLRTYNIPFERFFNKMPQEEERLEPPKKSEN